jgi:hypothetical protein
MKSPRFDIRAAALLSTRRNEYGTFASWLNFQRELFKFSKTRSFMVVTDIANYYDSISYIHLRNAISSIVGVEESIIDMLIFVLSNLLWQPDYMPRVEIGLPQINLDAPRLLAHCFLYDLDSFLANDPSRDFVRFMDDIDIGVDTVPAAKEILKSVDLVLQTKQIRLNSGKSSILSRSEAIKYFRIIDNARLDVLQKRIARRRRLGLDLTRDRRLVALRIRRGLKKNLFDEGNGEKILKRWIGLAGALQARIAKSDLLRIIMLRPTVRESVYIYIRSADLTAAKSEMLAMAAESGHLVDEAAMVDLVNNLVETSVPTTRGTQDNIQRIFLSCNQSTYFGLYCRLWLQSKYDTPSALLSTITSTTETWVPHERLGRLIGAFLPLFANTTEEEEYIKVLAGSRNDGARDAYKFQTRLATERGVFDAMFPALKNPNPSRGTRITHAKILCLLSALRNGDVPIGRRQQLKNVNNAVWRDIYYRRIARRLGV